MPGVSPLIVQLLYNRSVRTPTEVHTFLTTPEAWGHDPFSLPDVDIALGRVEKALRQRERIVIFGDFDVDGITSTAILVETLRALGAEAFPYIPHRLAEGYGLNLEAIDRFRQEGCSLLITADCGVSSVAEVEKAQAWGIDVIVTDHHARPPMPVRALATIVPPEHGLPLSGVAFASGGLAGCGVAFKVAQALLRTFPRRESLEGPELLDLVALGTVADMASLTGENRYLVQEGLRRINQSPRVGLQALMEAAGRRPGTVDAETIGYVLGPRLNAAGRLDNASKSYRLLTTQSLAEAQGLAQELEGWNTERRRLTELAWAQAREQVLEEATGGVPLLFASHPDFPEGIVGLVASKLVEEFYRPAVVVTQGTELSRGSARSIPPFHLAQALAQCADLFTRYGGHAQAAGFTVPTACLPELKQRLQAIAVATLQAQDLEPVLFIDAEVSLRRANWETKAALDQLAPFGSGNPTPLFLAKRLRVREARTFGNDVLHLRLKLHDGQLLWPAVAFRWGSSFIPEIGSLIDVVFALGVGSWEGEERLELQVKDLRLTPP